MTNGLSVNDITPLGERPADVWRGRTGVLGAGVFTIAGSAISGTPTDGQLLEYNAALDEWLPVDASSLGSVMWFNVKTYGATGDGTTDDTAAINLAIAALNAAGRGVLYFPAATYKITSALTTITVPCTILGDGHSALSWDSAGYVSHINQTSTTANALTITGDGVTVRSLAIANTAGSTPSAGAGIAITGGGNRQLIVDVGVTGFYRDIDQQYGALANYERLYLTNPVVDALRLQNIANTDSGDQSLVGCIFEAGARTASGSAAVRMLSAGGTKIVNCKVNYAGGAKFTNGLVMDVANGVSTSDLLIANCSIENFGTDGIVLNSAGTGSWISIAIIGVQFLGTSSGHAINAAAATLGKIANVAIDNVICWASSANANPAIALSKIDRVTIGVVLNVGSGYASLFSQTGCTNVVDNTGSVAAGLAIVADGNAAHYLDGSGAFSTPAGTGPTKGTPATSYGTPAAGAATTYIGTGATISKPTAPDVDFSADVTNNNVSTSAHGLAPKLPNDATKYLDGTGAYSVPAGSSSGAPAIPVWNVTFDGDGATTVFYLPAAPYDAYSIAVFVGTGRNADWTLSGAMLDVLTFGTAPVSGTNNISIDIMAST